MITAIKPNESLADHLDPEADSTEQKLEVFRRALALRDTPPLLSGADNPDPVATVKIHDPCGSWAWFLTEWDGDREAFGLVVGDEKERGYVDLQELAETSMVLDIGLEVDVSFLPTRLSQIHE